MTLKSQIDRFSQNEENFNALITGSAGTTVDLGEAGIVKSVATVIGEIAPGVDRGSWATTTAYIINDIVLENGAYYRCRENHTSGTFATDLAAGKWRLNQGGDSTILTHRGRALDDAFTARFETVTAMIADVNLEVGDKVVTYANQNGAAIRQEWKIVAAATGMEDGGSYIDLTGSGLQAKQNFGSQISLEQFAVPYDGVAYGNVAAQAALNYARDNSIKKVFVGQAGTVLMQGTSQLTIWEDIDFYGVGGKVTFKSEQGGRSAHYVQFSIRSGAKAHGFRVSGSDYTGAVTSDPNYTAWNKIGFSSQSGVNESRIKIYDIGFEKMSNSHIYMHNNTKNVDIYNCYTFGTQNGWSVNIDGTGLITDWNATEDSVARAAGTQVYMLTNFYNSGSSGTKNIRIYDNDCENINDSFIAVNGSCTRHKAWGNTCVKNADGYYGGFGLDFNGGSKCKAWGNTFEGHSYGAHYHANATKNKVFGNEISAFVGECYDTGASKNLSYGNEIELIQVTSNTKQSNVGRGAGAITRGSATIRNKVSNQILPSATSTSAINLTVSNVTNSGGSTSVTTTTPHGLYRRQIVEITGVTGVDCNGVWEVLPASSTTFTLIASSFSGSYSSGGTVVSGVAGIAACRDQADNVTSILSDACRFEDINTALWVGASSLSTIYDNCSTLSNVTTTRRGKNSYLNNLSDVSGISSSGTRARNLSGSVTVSSGTTTTLITFANEEPDASYKVLLSCNNEDLGLFWTSKTTAGFTINHINPAFNRTVDWMIVR